MERKCQKFVVENKGGQVTLEQKRIRIILEWNTRKTLEKRKIKRNLD